MMDLIQNEDTRIHSENSLLRQIKKKESEDEERLTDQMLMYVLRMGKKILETCDKMKTL